MTLIGQKLRRIEYLARKAFCPTGQGGGVDPTCGSGGQSGLREMVSKPAGEWSTNHVGRLVEPLVKNGKPNECYENARRELHKRVEQGEEAKYVIGNLYSVSHDDLRPVGGMDSDVLEKKSAGVQHAWVELKDGSISDATPFKYGRGDYRSLPERFAKENFERALYVPDRKVDPGELTQPLAYFPN